MILFATVFNALYKFVPIVVFIKAALAKQERDYEFSSDRSSHCVIGTGQSLAEMHMDILPRVFSSKSHSRLAHSLALW